MKGRSTSWFDRGELKALFKGVKPARPGASEAEPSSEGRGEEPPATTPQPGPDAVGTSVVEVTDPSGAKETFTAPAPESAPAPSPEAEAEPSAAPEELPAPEPPAALPLGSSPRVEAPLQATEAKADLLAPPAGLEPAPAPSPVPSLSQAPLTEPKPEVSEAAAPPSMPAPEVAPPAEPASPPATAPSLASPAPPPLAPDPASEALWRQSEALLHLARGQAWTQALEERLWEITETAASVLSLARASVWTFEDEERTRLRCADSYSAVRDTHESGQLQAARDHPLYFAALHSERPIVAHDAKADPRTRELAGGSLVPSQSRIEAPVVLAGRLAGVVRLEHEGSPRRFEHHEERFAATLADLAGLALEAQERRLKEAVARVGEERVRAQRDALAELSRGEALARGRLEGVLQEVTEAAARVLRLERASVWVYAPDYASLFCLDSFERASARHGRGAEIEGSRAPRYFESLKAGGRLSLTDAREEPRLAELVAAGHVPPGISSRLEVPIHLVGRLAGVFWCERAGSPKAWLADEERFAEALAGFVALVIATSERRRTENELRRALEDLDRSPAPRPGETLPPTPSRPAAAQAPDAFDEDLGDA